MDTGNLFYHFRKCALRLTGFVLLSLAGVALFILLAMFIFVMHCITVRVSIVLVCFWFTFDINLHVCVLHQPSTPLWANKTVAPWVCLVPIENVSQALFNSLSSKNFLYHVVKQSHLPSIKVFNGVQQLHPNWINTPLQFLLIRRTASNNFFMSLLWSKLLSLL